MGVDASGGLERYRLSGAEFASVSSGFGSESALATLRSAQLTQRMLLVTRVHQTIEPESSAWGVLRDVTGRRPEIGRDLLGHPFISTWALRYLKRPATASPASRSYLSSLAVAAAVRAGADLNLTIADSDGDVHIPTVGLAYGLGAGPVDIRLRDGRLTLRGTAATVEVPASLAADAPGWCVARSLMVRSVAGPLTVMVDDLDPLRSCFGHTVAPRLDPTAIAEVERLLDGAWQLIAADYPEHAVAIRACVRSLVPLVNPSSGSLSASAQTAFGAVAVSTPDSAAGLALLLIHETQHVKLGALIDLVDLFDGTRDGFFHAPWRADPRPAQALCQGVYAHAGVADFWRVRRTRTTGDQARRADFEFAYWLAQTRLAAEALARSGALTPDGERLAGHLLTTLDGWRGTRLDADLTDGVDDLMTAVAVRWRLDNHHTDPDVPANLATAWREGRPCPPIDPPTVPPAKQAGPARVEGLANQIRARLTTAAPPAAARAEAAYLSGHPHDAVAAYLEAASAAPEDPLAWTGLAVALSRTGDTAAAHALTARPDLVRATYTHLRGDADQPTPDALARWLAPAIP